MRAAWGNAVTEAGGQPSAEQVANAVRRRREPVVLHKPARGGRPHPAVYSDAIIAAIADCLTVTEPSSTRSPAPGESTSSAAPGSKRSVSKSSRPGRPCTRGPSWATLSPSTGCSPLRCDRNVAHLREQVRRRLRRLRPGGQKVVPLRLRRGAAPDNSGAMQWGPEYREFHEQAWTEAVRVLRPAAVSFSTSKTTSAKNDGRTWPHGTSRRSPPGDCT